MQTLYPCLRYRDADAAIDFLGRAFGFEAAEVHRDDDGRVAHAELEDADAHHAQAKEAGAEIVMELTDTDYGSRDYAAKDPEGNTWNFGTYRPA